MIHEYTFRIYYKDTDASGIAYHANYLAYAERARTEMFNEAGLAMPDLLKRGDSFVVSHAEIDYRRPAPLNSIVKIRSQIIKIKAASCLVEQLFYVDNQLITKIVVEAVSVDTNTLRPKRIPTDIRALYEKYLKETKGEENAK